MNRSSVRSSVAVCATLALVLAAFFVGTIAPRRAPVLEVAHPSWVDDFTKTSALERHSQNIFIGEVLSVKNVLDFYPPSDAEDPATRYEVRILESLKGGLKDEVVLHQFGGYTKDGKRLILIEGDWLLQPGRKYLFTTSAFSPETPDRQIVTNTFGHFDLSAVAPEEAALKVADMKAAVAVNR